MDMKMIILNENLNLFHSGPIYNDEYHRKNPKELTETQLDFLSKTMPKDKMDLSVPNHPKFFSLTAEHPYSYGVDNIMFGSVMYTLKKPVVLIDLEIKDNKDKIYLKLKEELHQLWPKVGEPFKNLNNYSDCFDGWIGYDDYPDPWREVFLFRPWECLSEGKRYFLKNVEEVVKKFREESYYIPTHVGIYYPYEDKELTILKKYLVGCFDIRYHGNNMMEILSETNSKCDSMSLKKVKM